MNKLILGLLLSTSSILLPGQEIANEWINFNQSYYKIKVAEDGLYRVTSTELQAAGVPVGSIIPSRYQLFRRGQEVALNIEQSNNTLTYLEFYGQKNDGTSDTELYLAPEAQQHTYYNLFTDTASYFLTWHLTSTSGNRMDFESDLNASGLDDEPHHLAELLQLQTENYSAGQKFGSGNALSSPKFDFGEGWTGGNIGKGGVETFSFDLIEADVNGRQPTVEVVLLGKNNLEHFVEIFAGPNTGALSLVGTASFSEQTNFTFTGSVDWSSVSSEGELLIRVQATGVTGQAEQIAVSSAKVIYPQDFETSAGINTLLHLRDTTTSRLSLRVPSDSPASFRVFDVTDPINPVRRSQTNLSSRFDFVVDDPSVSRDVYLASNPLSVASIDAVSFTELDFSAIEFLIITHRAIRFTGDNIDQAQAYADYRNSIAGGGISSVVLNISDIYDQFGYGDPGPVGMRNLFFSAAQGTVENALILGKGSSVNFGYYRERPDPSVLPHFVPTYGFPGSDLLFSVFPDDPNPQVSIGRVNALSAEDIRAYREKVEEMEAVPFDALWRKNVLQLSGGQNPDELRIFGNYIEDFRQIAEGNFLGGRAFNRNKQSASVVEVINVTDQINEGVGLVTFFGHSGANVTDIEIGRVSNPADGYMNQGKYPVLLINGCNAGEIFGETTDTFGEDWIRTPDLGAIAFIAHADFALSSGLKRYSDLFYETAFSIESHFGERLGDIGKRLSESYFDRFTTSRTSQSQVYSMVLQGDPLVRVFAASRPDYDLNGDFITIESASGGDPLATSDGLIFKLNVKNYGRSVTDSLEIRINRTLPDGSLRTFDETFLSIKYQDTLTITIPNDISDINTGNNLFQILLDPDNKIEELNEANNAENLELFLPDGSTIPLFPINFGKLPLGPVELLWQSANFLSTERIHRLEIDTTDLFNSPFKRTRTVSGQLLFSAEEEFPAFNDSTTVFWRTRFETPLEGEDTSWVVRSFSLIPAGGEGWGQLAESQLVESQLNGISFDQMTNDFKFLENTSDFEVNVHGSQSSLSYEDLRVIVNGENLILTDNPDDPFCRTNTINVVVLDKQSGVPFRPFGFSGGDVANDLVCGQLPQMIHNFTSDDVLGTRRYLDSIVSVVPSGTGMLIFSFDSVGFSSWDDRIKSSLNNIGIQTSTVDALVDGQPIIFFGTKGFAPGEAMEVVSDGSGLPITSQELDLTGIFTAKFSSGSVQSPLIGPAVEWVDGASFLGASNSNDVLEFQIIGINSVGEETQLLSAQSLQDADIGSIDATEFPFIKLVFDFQDELEQTPAQLQSWSVDFNAPAEGVLKSVEINTSTLQEGEVFTKPFEFINVSQVDFTDSAQVVFTLSNVTRNEITRDTILIAPVLAGDTIEFATSFNTVGQTGDNNLTATVRPRDLEIYEQNNTINFRNAVNVEEDQVNPVLDVTFDGTYILDGDIVSPNPIITIKLRDDNSFLFKTDTTGMNLSLKLPCETCEFERVSFSGGNINYSVASEDQDFQIEYQPGPLEDGVHSLRVQGTDESGNQSGAQAYEISFEVINESTISHFYPYPNPFSSSMRFVFTLTGLQMPDALKVQIMTVSGRVVREITQDEIGPIRVGNNITTYAWDGRDEFGDQLANGVYFYKVFIKKQGEPFKHLNTSADKSIKNGFGKIYLLR